MEIPPEAFGADDEPIPVTVLTGFLGSGKTTLLNRILTTDHGLRVAVILNEFGDISLDDQFIAGAADQLIELTNGCVCCTMQGDLLQALSLVLQSQRDIEYILVETTGLADPLPIAQALLRPDLQGLLRLDGIVGLVDAANFDRNLDHAEVAYNQLVYSDILLLNKVDLVEKETLEAIERGIRTLNADARILRCCHADVDLHLLLDVDVFKLQRLQTAPRWSPGSGSTTGFKAVTFRSQEPLDPARFQKFMESLPLAVFRGKGVVSIRGSDSRMIFHQVGDRCTLVPGAAWPEEGVRETLLVFIGKNLDAAELTGMLEACIA